MSRQQTPDSETEHPSHYDELLQAMQEGLLLTVNDNQPGITSTGELRVIHSDDDSTDVHLEGYDGSEYRIHRDRRDELILTYMKGGGESFESEVITLEVLGVAE